MVNDRLLDRRGRYARGVTQQRIDDELVRRWTEDYLAAWRSNDRAGIEALFTSDAAYRAQPDAPPTTGSTAIADEWIEHADGPASWQCEVAPTLVHDDTAIISGWTDYADGERYLNLWVVRFGDDGRCADFTEWWMHRRTST